MIVAALRAPTLPSSLALQLLCSLLLHRLLLPPRGDRVVWRTPERQEMVTVSRTALNRETYTTIALHSNVWETKRFR